MTENIVQVLVDTPLKAYIIIMAKLMLANVIIMGPIFLLFGVLGELASRKG